MPNNFILYNKYLHAYLIPGIHDFLLQYKEKFIGDYLRDKEEYYLKNRMVNPPIQNEKLFEIIDNLFYKVTKKYYIIGDRWDKSPIGVYIQDHNSYASTFHNHVPASLVATTYIDPIENESGGELEIPITPTIEKTLKIKPKKDYLYFFPGWLLHRPLPQKREESRICLNWVCETNYKPVHKLTGDRW